MQSIMQWAKTWTRIDPNMGLTPIPSRSGLIYLTPSLYGTLLLVYFVLAILTILSPSEPIKCSKEAVCQLRPCFMVEERLCNDVGNEILTGPLPNPSETARLEIRTTEHEPLANANEHHQRHAHSFKQAKSKVV
jgi:hypothetical protein